jgi:hypothetical protein
LSTRIIENLQQIVENDKLSSRQVPRTSGLAFFHFDQQQADVYSRWTALRTIAAQLLFSQRSDRNFIDIASLMMMEENEGQILASEQSLLSLIRVYLEQLDSSYLVFDALDECSEWDEFLISLRQCTEQTSSKIILISRPHLPISSFIGQKPFRMVLQQDANLTEIESILRPGITSLIMTDRLHGYSTQGESGELDLDMNKTEVLISNLARRADSIFLWAALMIQYVQSTFLTPAEREAVLSDEEPFRGLDKLYSKIMEDLQRRIPHSQYGKIHKIFEWLMTAQQPWTTKMLQTALAVQPNRKSTDSDVIEPFRESLLQLCGPLVEIREKGEVVRFIHLSVAEYLVKPAATAMKPSWSVNLRDAHCSMANLCLSYLRWEIPHRPLSEDEGSPPERSIVLAKYGLLPYVVTFWPFHANQSLEYNLFRDEADISYLPNETFKTLLKLLSEITKIKALVTSWIESSYLFETNPTLLNIPKHLETLSNNDGIRSDQRKVLENLSNTLKRLSNNLLHLNKRWGQTLSKEPNEIWLPSINALTDSEFWVGTNVAKVKWLSDPQDSDAVLILSQVSNDGKEVGVIKLWPARYVSRLFVTPWPAFIQY